MVNIANVINSQYPHWLYYRAGQGEAVQDEHGGWGESGAAWRLHGRCREETNGKGATIAAAGGNYITFSATIYLPQGASRIPERTPVIAADRELDADTLAKLDDAATVQALISEGAVRSSGDCLKFDLGRLHSRLWV